MTDFTKFPAELRALPRWVGWANVMRDGRMTKVLYNPKTREYASSTEPSTWTTFETVLKNAKFFRGPGLVILPPYCAIDLDQCRDPDNPGALEDWAKTIIEEVNSYTELSPSGRGYHIWCKASMPVKGRKRAMSNQFVLPAPDKKPGLEAYVTGRYFTVTAQRVDRVSYKQRISPDVETRDLSEWFTRYFGELTDAELNATYVPPEVQGDADPTSSGAEFSLACAVVRDLGPDVTIPQLVAEFMKRASVRPKLKRSDYVVRTIRNAISAVRVHRSRFKDPFEDIF